MSITPIGPSTATTRATGVARADVDELRIRRQEEREEEELRVRRQQAILEEQRQAVEAARDATEAARALQNQAEATGPGGDPNRPRHIDVYV